MLDGHPKAVLYQQPKGPQLKCGGNSDATLTSISTISTNTHKMTTGGASNAKRPSSFSANKMLEDVKLALYQQLQQQNQDGETELPFKSVSNATLTSISTISTTASNNEETSFITSSTTRRGKKDRAVPNDHPNDALLLPKLIAATAAAASSSVTTTSTSSRRKKDRLAKRTTMNNYDDDEVEVRVCINTINNDNNSQVEIVNGECKVMDKNNNSEFDSDHRLKLERRNIHIGGHKEEQIAIEISEKGLFLDSSHHNQASGQGRKKENNGNNRYGSQQEISDIHENSITSLASFDMDGVEENIPTKTTRKIVNPVDAAQQEQQQQVEGGNDEEEEDNYFLFYDDPTEDHYGGSVDQVDTTFIPLPQPISTTSKSNKLRPILQKPKITAFSDSGINNDNVIKDQSSRSESHNDDVITTSTLKPPQDQQNGSLSVNCQASQRSHMQEGKKQQQDQQQEQQPESYSYQTPKEIHEPTVCLSGDEKSKEVTVDGNNDRQPGTLFDGTNTQSEKEALANIVPVDKVEKGINITVNNDDDDNNSNNNNDDDSVIGGDKEQNQGATIQVQSRAVHAELDASNSIKQDKSKCEQQKATDDIDAATTITAFSAAPFTGSIMTMATATATTMTRGTSEAAHITALLRSLKYGGVRNLRYLTVDYTNTIQSQTVTIKHLLKSQSKSLDCPTSMATPLGDVDTSNKNKSGKQQQKQHHDSSSSCTIQDELLIKPDLSTLRILPYEPETAIVLGTIHDSSATTSCGDSLSPFCSRGALIQYMDYIAMNHSIVISGGVELEFCLYSTQGITTGCSTASLNQRENFINQLYCQLDAQDIQMELIQSDGGPGQLKIALQEESNPVTLADNVLLTKETMSMVARELNLEVVFSPKNNSKSSKNGLLSLQLQLTVHNEATVPLIVSSGNQDDVNTAKEAGGTSSPPSPSPLSSLSLSSSSSPSIISCFVQGVVRHLPSILSLTLPDTNSWHLMQSCNSSSTLSSLDDPQGFIRIISEIDKRDYVELKLCDSQANLYLALLAILTCGCNGIMNIQQEAKPLHNTEYSTIKFPSNLEESLDYLEKDELISSIMDSEVFKAYIATLRKGTVKTNK